MALMVFANVALRFLTDYSILWVEEVSRYTMIWLTFIGAGPVLRYGGHIGIDTLQQGMPRFAPAIRAVIVFAARHFLLRDDRHRRPVRESHVGANDAGAWRFPIGAVYLAMPVGFGLMIIHLRDDGPRIRRAAELLGDGEFDADAVKLSSLTRWSPFSSSAASRCSRSACPSPSRSAARRWSRCGRGSVPLVALPKYLFSGIDLFALEAVPFFILTAELMTGGELSAVLLRFASQFVGRFRGGHGPHEHPDADVLLRHFGLGARRCGRARARS